MVQEDVVDEKTNWGKCGNVLHALWVPVDVDRYGVGRNI